MSVFYYKLIECLLWSELWNVILSDVGALEFSHGLVEIGRKKWHLLSGVTIRNPSTPSTRYIHIFSSLRDISHLPVEYSLIPGSTLEMPGCRYYDFTTVVPTSTALDDIMVTGTVRVLRTDWHFVTLSSHLSCEKCNKCLVTSNRKFCEW